MDDEEGPFPEFPGIDEDDVLIESAGPHFGTRYLYPYQRLVVSNVMEAALGRDGEESPYARQVVILPTGAGKSLCFQLPALLLPGLTIVIFPLLSLMADQERRLKKAGVEPGLLRGGQTQAERDAIFDGIRSGRVKLILTNPETLVTPAVEKSIETLELSHLVIDEAHCVSEWGESFRPSYLEIGPFIARHDPTVVTAFTATASSVVLEKVRKLLFGESSVHLIAGNPDRPNISYEVLPTLSKSRELFGIAKNCERPLLVFCRSRDGAEITSRNLRERVGTSVFFYHAGLTREEKKLREEWFFSSRDGVLCATCAYGLGIDKPDIRTVVHRDVPPSVEAYLQESGRAGRDGLPARAILLRSREDDERLARLESDTDRERMRAIIAYADDSSKCRREVLLSLLGAESEACSGCDVCSRTQRKVPCETEQLGTFIARNRRRFGRGELKAVLRGATAPDLIDSGFALEPGRRLLDDWCEDDVEEAVGELIRQGTIRVEPKGFWKGSIGVGPRYSSERPRFFSFLTRVLK